MNPSIILDFVKRWGFVYLVWHMGFSVAGLVKGQSVHLNDWLGYAVTFVLAMIATLYRIRNAR